MAWRFKNKKEAEEATRIVSMNRQFPPSGRLQKQINRYRKMEEKYRLKTIINCKVKPALEKITPALPHGQEKAKKKG